MGSAGPECGLVVLLPDSDPMADVGVATEEDLRLFVGSSAASSGSSFREGLVSDVGVDRASDSPIIEELDVGLPDSARLARAMGPFISLPPVVTPFSGSVAGGGDEDLPFEANFLSPSTLSAPAFSTSARLVKW